MTAYLKLPVTFFKFWYIDAPLELISYFGSCNKALLHLFSFPLLLSTFFKPLKNEYREGLVGFSIGMGIVIKSALILFDLMLFLILFLLEAAVVVLFLALPILTFIILVGL